MGALESFLGREPAERLARGRPLCLWNYLLIGGVLFTGLASFNDLDPMFGLRAGLAHLGGGSALA